MLQTIALGSISLSPHAYFYDKLNNQLYFLRDGHLTSHHLTTKQQKAIPINASSAPSIHPNPNTLTLLSGQVVSNVHKNIVSASSDEAVLRGLVQIVDGSSWQWHAPISLQKIKLGICKIEDNQQVKYELFDFNSSTSRTVSFSVHGNQLSVLVNGYSPKKNSTKTISYDQSKNKWYPCAKLQQKGNTLIYAPLTFNKALPLASKYDLVFGKNQDLEQAAKEEAPTNERPQLKISKLIQLNRDSLLIVWENNAARLFQRNKKSGRFQFLPFSVHQNTVYDLFTHQQYSLLSSWRNQQHILDNSSALSLQQAYSTIKSLLKVVCVQKQAFRQDILFLLVTRIAALRPYLLAANISVPDVTSLLNSSNQSIQQNLNYGPSFGANTSIRSSQQYQLQGSFLDVTENYLITKNQNTIILYNTKNTVTEIFRETVDQKLLFSKRSAAQKYDEQDIRNLKNQGSFLYKILSGCLQKGKKSDEPHVVNQNDVKELIRDYGIDEASARQALQQTGHVEQALVWIFTDKQDGKAKKGENQKEIQSEKVSSVHIVELNNIFARLLLQVGNRLFVLGVLPNQLRNWYYKGQKQYIDLVTFKHQDDLNSLPWKSWYSGSQHPHLHILDQTQLPQIPHLIYKQKEEIYWVYEAQKVLHRKKIIFNADLLYEPQDSLVLSSQAFPLQTKGENVGKTLKGQLIFHENISVGNFSDDTVWANANQLYSNIVDHSQRVATVVLKQQQVAFQDKLSSSDKNIPFIIDSSPPGCSSNYSVASMLHPKSSFLANYPSKIILRHLHNKLINLTTFTLHRSSQRKNVNFVQGGEIYLFDSDGNESKRVSFSFQKDENEKEIKVQISGYWKYVVLAPQFTQVKKVPYQYGFISIKGHDATPQQYHSQFVQTLTPLLHSKINQPFTVIGWRKVGNNVEAKIKLQSQLQQGEEVRLNKELSFSEDVVASSSQLQENREVAFLRPSQIIKLLYPDSSHRESVLRSISRSSIFNFASFSKTQVFKFIDLTLYYTGSLLNLNDYFTSMFKKLWQNQFGKQYLLQLSKSLESSPTIPFPYLKLLVGELDTNQHVSTIQSLLSILPSVRSTKYDSVDRKYSHLLFETQFYSDYYVNLIQGKQQEKEQLFSQPYIQSEFVAIKDENSRRIIVKLGSEHRITNFAFRVERCEQASKVKYRVYKLNQKGKQQIGSGVIQEHQWAQISREVYKFSNEDQTDNNIKALNIYGLTVDPVTTQYLQIQLLFTETGIISHQSESSKIPQVDIIPELYGYPTHLSSKIEQYESIFSFNPEEMFFLSVSSLGTNPLHKYSVSRGKQTQCLYFKPQRQELASFKTKIQQKIERGEFDSLVHLQKKLISNTRSFSNKVCLDYVYTVLILCLNQLEKRQVRLQEDICKKLFELIVKTSQGPIKIYAFKALSKRTPLLIKSLQYVQEIFPTLGKLSFSYEELLDVVDLSNLQLCQSLTHLILRVVDYEARWAELLIKMSGKTQAHQQIVKYFSCKDDWLDNNNILEYIASFSEPFFQNTFLSSISYSQLSKLVTKKNSQSRVELLLEVIVEKASETSQVDLDVVSLIFQQPQVRWQQLQKVVSCCAQATDTVIHQFLQAEDPSIALENYELLNIAATNSKYSEQFAIFLNKIYLKSKSSFRDVVLSIIGKCTSLHYDCLQTISQFVFSSCNFGGMQGVKLLSEKELFNLQVGVESLRVLEKVPEGAEISNEDSFIEWYLNNNDYQQSNRNPANKSPAYHLMRQLVELVKNILKSASPSKVLTKYSQLVQQLQNSRKTSLFRKHLLFNQLHHGATQLLAHTLTPGSLADVLVGPNNPVLSTVINELKSNILKEGAKKNKLFNEKQIDITEKFQLKDVEVKDLQGGKAGNRTPVAKIAISQKTLRLQSTQTQWPSKFVIGFCLNDHLDNKNAILPSKVQLFGGNGNTLFKVGELKLIEDQFYLSFGVRLFAINLSTISSLGSSCIKNLQVRLFQPSLSSASQILQNGQRSKKAATYNISFININGYDNLPSEHPDYSQLYVTLLGFLGQPKYHSDLKKVIASDLFDQKLQLIIQVLNDLLPNESIQNLLLTLNKQGQNILEHILRSKGANSRLISKLILGKLTKENLNKLLTYTLNSLTQQYVSIVTKSIRLASYSNPDKQPLKVYSQFANIHKLIEKYQTAEASTKRLYYEIIVSLLSVPNLYHYDLSKLIELVWNSPKKSELYSILAAVLPYYSKQIQIFTSNDYTTTVFNQLIQILQQNKKAQQILKSPENQIMLLNTLISSQSSRAHLLSIKGPIKIVELLRSDKSLLQKYSSQVMKLFITFFQGTCIATECQDEFSQILISLMTSLNNFEAIHHQFFIHNFFFPLINSFKGVPLFFVWKEKHEYLWQPTQILKRNPIRSSSKILNYKDKFYHPIETVNESSVKGDLIFVLKQNNHVSFSLKDGQLTDLQNNKKLPYAFAQNKLTITLGSESNLTVPNQKYSIYQQSQWEHQLLTNTTLINLQNPWILEAKYRSALPIRQSTSQRCYYLPLQISLAQVLKQINISGFRVHNTDLPKIKISNYLTGKELAHQLTLRKVLQNQSLPYLKIEIQASELFSSTTIESLVQEKSTHTSFVAEETIFKAFEQKKGLQKLIGVLTGCIGNWVNKEQSKVWQQYLKQLQSYSCFPIFSSLYMTKPDNVSLLFDLLFGLPDKQDSKKWIQKEKQSVKELYAIVKDVFAVEGDQAITVRNYALKSGFYSTMLNRLHLITKEPKRQKVEQVKEEQEIQAPTSLQKKQSEQEYKAKLQKRKGVGYGTDSSTNQKWDVTGQQQARKDQSQQILSLLKILQKFLDYKGFDFPEKILEQTYQSSLLPIIENSLRGGSLLEISKYAELIQGQLNFIQVLAKSKKLIPTLLPLPKNYEPRQPESLHSLLKTLANTSKIFLSCLTGSASQKVSQQIAKKIAATFEQVDEAVAEYETAHNDEDQDRKILQLPLAKKYPILLKDLRFDYIDMKDSNGKISKHHYGSYYQVGHKSPVQKTVRLAQQLADVSHALPIDHTNAIYVRCDKERVDYMQALIMGSNGTPYGHGAYLFDIYFEDTYPNGPPKVNLTTTGNGQIRFNPNLYACGKVCLSLLGTWRGQASQNWDPKVSTLLQVLVSIQSIIMSEDIYFNEPGFEHEQGTVEGQKKNQAYANIVRYGNVKFAMTENIKNPPKGFQTIIRRHFYLKKAQILEQCQKWIKLAQKRQASYTGLVNDHNCNWGATFKKSKNEYKTMLEKAIKQLQVQLNKLPPPTSEDLKKEQSPQKQKRKVKVEEVPIKEEPIFQQIDVSYGQARENVELDINDEKVKDRWSRYIGAMGVEAVSKQSKANILLLGLGGLGVQIAKNIVLSGCKEFAVWDDKQVKWQDLSGQFFLGQGDIGKSRLQSTIYKLQELNHYVKVSKFQYDTNKLDNMSKFNVVIATQVNHNDQQKINQFCRNNKIHFVSADCYGPYGQLFNDFGEEFEIIDKNGEQTAEIILEDITNAQKGLVRVAKGLRHPFEDGETVRFIGVKGLKSIENKQQSINGTLHKVQVIDQYSFYIGNTLNYTPYEGDGTVRNIKTPTKLKFKSLKQSVALQNIDSNLQYYDFSKGANLRLLHHAFLGLSQFRTNNQRLPHNWNRQDADLLIQQVKKIKAQLSDDEIKYLRLFSYTCSGNFGPIFALYGGIASQEVFKAITGKYTPINQYFLADFSQVVEQPPTDQAQWPAFVQAKKSANNDRRQGIKRVIGNQLLTKLQNSKIFMVGSGAIGCELLKNFAMLQIGTGQNGGSIVVTDPDHIQTSNLNRQFLFREKHLRKPKSATAAAVVTQMNPRLKGHIKARLDKVCQSTKDLFSNEFFEGLSIVTNALDNVQARRYVDSRCVENKVALLESGTLSSKGHVQVIIPYKTETYGSKQDPNDANGEVPHCTLKMFPEETLHCVEWARDLFGKEFTLSPKALAKLLETESTFVAGPSDIQMLKDCLKMLQSRPTNFEQAAGTAAKVFHQLFKNDILQLLYTYPLDAKTKDGKLFWRLPKRPPTQIPQINPEDPLHATFISSYSVLLSKIHGIPYPKDFRDPLKRKEIAQISTKFKVDPFVPSDKVAKEMTEEVNNQNDKKQEGKQIQQVVVQEGENELFQRFKQVLSQLRQGGQVLSSKAQQFEKDQDQNGHIDLIYSMANLRARNYKLEQMDWINVKLKAGRIMPALSTTTSCIAALQTIELVKYIKGCKVDQMRNAFINLAVPLLQLGEPGEVEKIKVHDNLETTLWERWEVSAKKESTLRDLISQIESKYGVSVKGLNLADGGQIYSDIVLGLQSKKEEKEKLLSKQLKQILLQEVEQESVKFVDFTLLMSVKQQLVKHAPTLRLAFQ